MAQENIGKRFEGYQIYDRHYEKVGKVEALFVDENDVPEYIGVKTSLFGGPSTLIPMDIVRVNDLRQLVEVASDKDTIKECPSFGDDAEITAEFEERVYAHFGATREPPPTDRGGYDAYHDENADVDLAYGERSRVPEYGAVPAAPVEYEYPGGDRSSGGPMSRSKSLKLTGARPLPFSAAGSSRFVTARTYTPRSRGRPNLTSRMLSSAWLVA